MLRESTVKSRPVLLAELSVSDHNFSGSLPDILLTFPINASGLAKYNRLLEIEAELSEKGESFKYAGTDGFARGLEAPALKST